MSDARTDKPIFLRQKIDVLPQAVRDIAKILQERGEIVITDGREST